MDWDRTHQFCGRCGTPAMPVGYVQHTGRFCRTR
jgi:NADH pyrophosphatase NudC (nudix superfamily)